MMEYFNKKMEKILSQERSNELCISSDLMRVLSMGFENYNQGIFFKEFFNENIKMIIDKNAYNDMSGLEYTSNKFFSSDYCGEYKKASPILFINEFSYFWCRKYKNECIAVIAYDETSSLEDGFIFTFYQQRDSEIVIDLNDIDSFDQPLMVRRITP